MGGFFRIFRRLFIDADLVAWLVIVLLITLAYNLWALSEAWHMFSVQIPMKSPG
ncbi:MAG TPA: hypothetical protein VNL13_09465 [Sulfolobales archaeon]|nr:hypothetical protein [Sulfolobales archaeon]